MWERIMTGVLYISANLYCICVSVCLIPLKQLWYWFAVILGPPQYDISNQCYNNEIFERLKDIELTGCADLQWVRDERGVSAGQPRGDLCLSHGIPGKRQFQFCELFVENLRIFLCLTKFIYYHIIYWL